MRVTVLGGTGLLGSHVVPLLIEAGHEVSVTSRSDREGLVKTNLETGAGLAQAVADADVVVHLASDARKPKRVDIGGTAKLLEVLEDGQHVVYMSIVGVDQHPFGYYQAKFQVEQMLAASSLPHTVLRATQFHDFVAFFLGAACKPPVALVPKKFVFQPVDTGEVATELAALVRDPRPGVQPDFAGPEVHTAEHLARTLMEARGRERPMLNLPVFGKAANAFRKGVHTNEDRAVGEGTWAEFLEAGS